jgi:hypothetical protein
MLLCKNLNFMRRTMSAIGDKANIKIKIRHVR